MKKELKLITAEEAASRLKVHHKTIARLLRNKKISGIKLANRWLVRESVLDEFSKRYSGTKGRPKDATRKGGKNESTGT